MKPRQWQLVRDLDSPDSPVYRLYLRSDRDQWEPVLVIHGDALLAELGEAVTGEPRELSAGRSFQSFMTVNAVPVTAGRPVPRRKATP